MNRPLLASLLVATVPAFAGPYDQPYSIVTTDLAKSADPNLIPVIVNRVDGETIMTRTEAVILPGKHEVTVDVPPRQGFHQATQNVFALDTKPCVRYYVAAKLDNRLSQRWVPVIRSEEPIGECRKKFDIADAR